MVLACSTLLPGTYKILTGKYDVIAVPNLSIPTTLTTRGDDFRLQKNRTRYDLRKFFFY